MFPVAWVTSERKGSKTHRSASFVQVNAHTEHASTFADVQDCI